jgi:hypothetical protein
MAGGIKGARAGSTVTIHKDGTVTYCSPLTMKIARVLPETITPRELQRMSKPDRRRLYFVFGTTKPPGGEVRLMSKDERAAGTERMDRPAVSP